MALVSFTDRGIYCRQADVYIDPSKKVDKAIVTHGHSDHARRGHKHYIASHKSIPSIKHRLGKINIRGLAYGESLSVNGVNISLHPAGHIIGSAQVRLEYKGEIWVISGDYKIEDDGLAMPYENLRCHHFVTESTFAMPIYQWQPQKEVMGQINEWWKNNKEMGKTSVITAYSLGKAQRLLNTVDHTIGSVFTHETIEKTNIALRAGGINLPDSIQIDAGHTAKDITGNLVIVPPSVLGSPLMEKFGAVSTAAASGWMAIRKTRKNRVTDRGFVLSDHADWKGLNEAIIGSQAEHVHVTHGYEHLFSKWLNEQGFQATAVKTEHDDYIEKSSKGINK